MDFSTPLSEIFGVGASYISKLEKLGLLNIGDLLFHFPSRYEDFSSQKNIAELKEGERATISGSILKISNRRSWSNKKLLLTDAVIEDETGKIRVTWFNQPYLLKSLPIGTKINLAGKIITDSKGISLSNPYYERIFEDANETRETKGLIPIYPETRGLTSRYLRFLIKKVLEKSKFPNDPLPSDLKKKLSLPSFKSSVKKIHFPKNSKEANLSRYRFSFENLFKLQLALISEKNRVKKLSAFSMKMKKEPLKKLADSLGFKLTPSQKKSLSEILKDLANPYPMNRLLQGDVGSGKTIVAALAALAVTENNYQAILMVPTEILALQHFKKFKDLFSDFNLSLGLATASQNKIAFSNNEAKISKKEFLKKSQSGEIDIVIGTHSLIQKGVSFKELGLVVIDEQHRFGIDQRSSLLNNNKKSPHLLSMTATPIPRTLALTLWGDMDVSLLTDKPVGRKKIVTKLVDPKNRNKAYQFVRQQIQSGRQAFVICPLVDDSEKIEVKSATQEYERLKKKVFPQSNIALIHGKTKAKEKEKIMGDFKDGEIDILVATPVIEVGIDIPNATIMIIEGAERFGLAQIHQFRGRVGRGTHQSYCLLFSEKASETAKKRLDIVVEAKNSFELAEMDLENRGPGQFLGDKQSGLPDYIMEALKNISLVKTAKEEASQILSKDPLLKKYPLLKEGISKNRGLNYKLN